MNEKGTKRKNLDMEAKKRCKYEQRDWSDNAKRIWVREGRALCNPESVNLKWKMKNRESK